MIKKILMLSILLLTMIGFTCNDVTAATPRINDFTWGVNKENVFRAVFDCSQPTKAKIEMQGSDLVVTVNATNTKASMLKKYTFPSDTIRHVTVEKQDINHTVLRIRLKKTLNSGDYKLFVLKKDPGAKRPDRVVVDVANGPKRQSVSVSGNTNSSYKGSIPTYIVSGGIKGKKITLDAGHGGSDPGAHGKAGVLEKSVTLPVTMKVRDLLRKKGAIVSMTRTTDVDVYGPNASDRAELQARVDVAQANRADLFISLHCNASPNTSVGGFSTYYYPKTRYDYNVASNIQKRLLKTANLRDLGVRQANFYVNKRCTMPGSLVEMLFLSNKREEKLLSSNWFQNKLANAIADGIEDFYNKNGGA